MPSLPRPEGHNSVTASFIVPNLRGLLPFLARVFGARVVDQYEGPDGAILHAELRIADSVVMCSEPQPGWSTRPGLFTVYVEDGATVDAKYRLALEQGATSVKAPSDEFYGHRNATFDDAAGNRWSLSAVVEQVSMEESHRRLEKMMKG